METLDRGSQGHCCHCGLKMQGRDPRDWDVRDMHIRDWEVRDRDIRDWDNRDLDTRNWDTSDWETIDQGEPITALDDSTERRVRTQPR